MKNTGTMDARKRPVNLTLNENLVTQVKDLTGNLSGVVESLLMDYVEHERVRRDAERRALQKTVTLWNTFHEQHGAFADDHSTL